MKINKKKLRTVINEAIDKVLFENNADSKNIALSSQFEDGLYAMEEMYRNLKGFISEYQIFVKSLLQHTHKIGLQLSDLSTEKYFDIKDAVSGRPFDFYFKFTFPDVDITSMNDEDYSAFEEKLNIAYNELHNVIGNPSFGVIDMYIVDDGIKVIYSFKLNK